MAGDNTAPYDSAGDLPSVVEMRQLIRGFKGLTRIVARTQRKDILKIEADLERLVKLVDDFYTLLGSRHWIFHDDLNAEKIAVLIDLPAEDAEHQLIALYQDEETLTFLVRRLNTRHSQFASVMFH